MSEQIPLPHLEDRDVNKDTSLNKYTDGVTVILYYMPGCHWCKEFKPAYIEAAKEGSAKGYNFVVVDITTKDGSSIQDKINNVKKPKFMVKGVPKVAGYKNGKFYAVYAPGNKQTYRTKDDVLKFAKGVKNGAKVEVDPKAAS
jgi:thiol-disulfide isomerase/thioredoxin